MPYPVGYGASCVEVGNLRHGIVSCVVFALMPWHNIARRLCQLLGGGKGERENECTVGLVPILVADGHTVCGTVASYIPDDQRSPAPSVHTKLLLCAPCKSKAAILFRGNKHVYFLTLAL